MNANLKFCAFAGIVYLVSFLPELTIETLREFGQINGISSTLLRITYIVSTLSTIFFYAGFIVLGNKYKNNLLLVGALIIILTTIFYYIYEWYTVDISEVEKNIVGASALLLYGFSGIVFGVGLYRIKDVFGYLASAAAILEITIGIFFVTIVLFLLGLILTIPAIIFEILLLFKASELSTVNDAVRNDFERSG